MAGIEAQTPKREIVIKLSPGEVADCAAWAAQHQHDALRAHARRWGPSGLLTHTLGLQGELAAERYLGLPLRNRRITYAEEARQHFDTLPPGAVQIRARSSPRYGLPFVPARRNCPWCPYILAFIPDSDSGIVYLRGWTIGEQIQAEGRFIDKTGYPFFALSPDRLFALPERPHPYFYLDQTICRKMRINAP